MLYSETEQVKNIGFISEAVNNMFYEETKQLYTIKSN